MYTVQAAHAAVQEDTCATTAFRRWPQIADTASLADVVFSRADSQPQAVALRRRSDDGTWQDVTAGAFRDEVTALAKGLIAAGRRAGRPDRPDVPHPV